MGDGFKCSLIMAHVETVVVGEIGGNQAGVASRGLFPLAGVPGWFYGAYIIGTHLHYQEQPGMRIFRNFNCRALQLQHSMADAAHLRVSLLRSPGSSELVVNRRVQTLMTN